MNTIIEVVQKAIEQQLNATVYNTQVVNGGDINQTFLLSTSKGSFFVKLNQQEFTPQMFETETKGLALLNNSLHIPIPSSTIIYSVLLFLLQLL